MTELGSIEADLGLGEDRADAIVLSGDSAGVVIGDAVSPDIVKRSIVVAGHKTSVSLEDAFWLALKDIARERGQSLRSLVAEIDAGRKGGNLSSAVRLHVLDHYRRRAGAIGAVRG
ncbi:putative DNA-binding ribbon-helix-helix protein [Methylopila jiangsuensis]|nr:putative DNA-binding ribbon-helix-helix protein [Methylopila jiangsuensis]